jgi:hypothetical protein
MALPIKSANIVPSWTGCAICRIGRSRGFGADYFITLSICSAQPLRHRRSVGK